MASRKLMLLCLVTISFVVMPVITVQRRFSYSNKPTVDDAQELDVDAPDVEQQQFIDFNRPTAEYEQELNVDELDVEQRQFSYSSRPTSEDDQEMNVDTFADTDGNTFDYGSKSYGEKTWARKIPVYEQTVQSLMARFINSTDILRKSFEKLLPPQIKEDFQIIMQNIISFLNFRKEDPVIQVIESIVETLSPDLMIENFVDDLQDLVILSNSIMPGSFRNILKILETNSMGSEDYVDGKDNFASDKDLAFGLYSFLVEQELRFLENIQSMIEIFVSQLDSTEEIFVPISSEEILASDTSTTASTTTESLAF